jgi:uncharacterized membrane protein
MSYQWWRFLHIAGAFFFLIAHGVSIATTFRVRKERNRERIAALLELSARTVTWMYVGLLVLIAAGVVLGFIIHAWGRGWIWTAIAILVALIVAMGALARPYYERLRNAVTARRGEGYLISDEELEEALMSGRPWLIAAIGSIGLAAILWLMVFRPF